jgi:hypothetical protein
MATMCNMPWFHGESPVSRALRAGVQVGEVE